MCGVQRLAFQECECFFLVVVLLEVTGPDVTICRRCVFVNAIISCYHRCVRFVNLSGNPSVGSVDVVDNDGRPISKHYIDRCFSTTSRK